MTGVQTCALPISEINALSTLMFLVVLALLLTVNIRQARQETAALRRRAKLNPGR